MPPTLLVEQLTDLWERWADPAINLARHEYEELDRMVECAKRFNTMKAKHFVQQRKTEPLLCHYESDDTHSRTRKRYVVKLDDATRTHREGGKNSEVLIDRCFIAGKKFQSQNLETPQARTLKLELSS